MTWLKSINKQLLHDVVVMYQANAASGLHRTNKVAVTWPVHDAKRCIARREPVTLVPVRVGQTCPTRWWSRICQRIIAIIRIACLEKGVRLATRMAMAGKIQSEQVGDRRRSVDGYEPKTKEIAVAAESVGLGW